MESRFGVLEFLHWNHSWNNHKYATREEVARCIALIKEAGAGWVRVDFLWQDIQPEPGKWQFEKYDYIVRELRRNNIGILGILGYSADWSSSCGKWNCPPRDNDLFIKYAARVARRYKGKVRHWEIWNEPDSSVYWMPQDGLARYVRLLKEVYAALKKIDPGCKILNGGLANGLASVNRLYDAGAQDYFDIFNIHVFENTFESDSAKAVVNFVKLAQKKMVQHNDAGKEIWITEIGCPGVGAGQEVKNWWLGRNADEEQQAQWLKKVFTELLKDGSADKIFWAFFRDCKQHWKDGTDYFGLIRWDFSRKPAFFAYKECAKETGLGE